MKKVQSVQGMKMSPPSKDLQDNVHSILRALQQHLGQIDNLIDDNVERSNYKQRFFEALKELESAKYCSKTLRKLLPDYKLTWNELDLALEASENMINVSQGMFEVALNPPPDVEKYQKLVQRNRMWDTEQQKHFQRFGSLLPNWINFNDS